MNQRLLNVLGALVIFLIPVVPARAQIAVREAVTPGGIAFRYVQMPRARFQAIMFGWADGYALSLPEGQGIGAWGASMILQGPEGASRAEFEEDAKDAQARMNLQSGWRSTLGSLTAPPDKMGEAVALFSRALAMPALDADRLKDRIGNRKLLVRQSRVKAEVMAADIVSYLFLAPGPVRQWRLGDERMLDEISVPRIEAWRKAVLTRNGLHVTAAGPEPIETAAAQIDKLLGHLPAMGEAQRQPVVPLLSSAKTVALKAPVPQTYLQIGGWTGFTRQDDPFVADLLTPILRERLFKAVREQLGAAYGARAQLGSLGGDVHFLSAVAAVEHDKAGAALAAMRSELARFTAEGVTASEFEAAKERSLSEARQRLRGAPYVARILRNAMVEGRPKGFAEAYEQRLMAVTLDQVNTAIREKLANRPLATIIVTPDDTGFQADCRIDTPAKAETCR